ncbi:MAG: CarD family transcriptional regulator [Lachnospiraceae bacterium]|nr:CarD family transcriptional regulator [Lachnospiraceae bacterium]MBR4994295.1 CarD family transcriptional regulator [Lachnospiraceae bacterium]MBR5945347.1 CarD family transcriptional regulator [Lachnospiraceae bacterium]
MFNKGAFIVYGSKGICKVNDVTTLTMDGIDKDRLYYVLMPCDKKQSTVYVPVDSNKTVMREVITKDEADSLISDIPYIEEIWVDNDKAREAKYKECLSSCECREWVRIIKTLYTRKEKRIKEGKKVTATDERYFKMAEDYLYSELSIALSIPKNEIEGYIWQKN